MKGKRFGKPLPGYLYNNERYKSCFRFLVKEIKDEPYKGPVDWAGTNYDPEGPFYRNTEKAKNTNYDVPHRRRHPLQRRGRGRRRRRKGKQQPIDR